jgi:hypothetical protein
MATWPERACTALTVYYERGVRALELIKRNEWEEAEAILNLRKAAFHNFRAADHQALKQGYTAEQDAQLKTIWSQICAVDADLLSAMEGAKVAMETELVRVSKVKSTLGRFRSGQVLESHLEKPV